MGGKRWTEEEIQFIRENYSCYKSKFGVGAERHLAIKLRRAISSVRSKALQLELKSSSLNDGKCTVKSDKLILW
jgi:hypothetical protein